VTTLNRVLEPIYGVKHRREPVFTAVGQIEFNSGKTAWPNVIGCHELGEQPMHLLEEVASILPGDIPARSYPANSPSSAVQLSRAMFDRTPKEPTVYIRGHLRMLRLGEHLSLTQHFLPSIKHPEMTSARPRYHRGAPGLSLR